MVQNESLHKKITPAAKQKEMNMYNVLKLEEKPGILSETQKWFKGREIWQHDQEERIFKFSGSIN